MAVYFDTFRYVRQYFVHFYEDGTKFKIPIKIQFFGSL